MTKLVNRAKMSTATTGTGTITLGSAESGYQSFADAGVVNADVVRYVIEDGTDWEIGTGTYTATGTTLTRTVLESSNADAALNLTGSAVVYVSAAAEDIPSPTLTIDNKTGAYTVVADDLGKIINCTSGTFTVSLTSAATLGAGFYCWVWNTSDTSTDVITIDPDGSETVDKISSLVLRRGEGTEIISDGANWQVGAKQTMRLYAENTTTQAQPIAEASNSIAIGAAASATGVSSVCFGFGTAASGLNSAAIGRNSGGQGSQAITGSGAMALGGSYASGADSFAAAIANNTSSYGATGANSVAIGKLARATQTSAIAFGDGAISTGAGGYSIAIGYQANASAPGAIAIGNQYYIGAPVASGGSSIAIGDDAEATQRFSTALGAASISRIWGKYAYAGGRFSAVGDAQTGAFVLRSDTTDATPEALTTDNSVAGAINQIILPNNSAYSFSGTIIARQQASAGSGYASWEIKGALLRDGSAATTVLGNGIVNKLYATAGASAWAVALTADTTNGGLAITVTGAAATNIRWVAAVHTSEVTY